MPLQDTDKILVNRGGTDYKVSASDLDDKLQDDDQVLINRGGTDYKVSGADLRTYLGIAKPPWEGHPNTCIFHVRNATQEVKLRAEAQAWNIDGTDKGLISEIQPGEEVVFITNPTPDGLFRENSGNWEFGPLTDVSNGTNFSIMFNNCPNFNYDISDWDVHRCINNGLNGMFDGCRSYNQDLSQWCVPDVTISDYSDGPHMFDYDCLSWTLPKPCWGHCPRGENGTVDPCP